jgi:hypothetical protein
MRKVATDINVSENKLQQATAHVGTLESNSSMTPPQIDPTALQTVGPTASVASGVMAGHKLTGDNPIYPEGAKSPCQRICCHTRPHWHRWAHSLHESYLGTGS